MNDDEQYETKTIAEVRDENGYWSMKFDDGWWLSLAKGHEVEPKVGDEARLYGRGIGCPVRGVVVAGKVAFYRSEADEAAKQRGQHHARPLQRAGAGVPAMTTTPTDADREAAHALAAVLLGEFNHGDTAPLAAALYPRLAAALVDFATTAREEGRQAGLREGADLCAKRATEWEGKAAAGFYERYSRDRAVEAMTIEDKLRRMADPRLSGQPSTQGSGTK